MPTDQPDLIVERYLRRLGGGRPDPAALTFYASLDQMRSVDPLVAERVVAELVDQRSNIKLIASENYASLAVQQAMGNRLTDKYAEGSAGHRFYAGCDNVDAIESHGAELAKALFGAEHAYVQPHSGIDANLVAFMAMLATRVEDRFLERLDVKNVSALSDEEFAALRTELHDQRMLGMAYDSGGHLTHGFRFNISSRLFDARGYTVDRETCLLDYDALRAQLHEVRPLILLAGYSSYPRKINFRGCARSPTRSAPRSWSTWRTSPGWSPARCLPATTTRSARAHRHHHHPQDLAWSPRRPRPVLGGVRRVRRPGLPARAGRPAAARHGSEGGGAEGGVAAVVPGLCGPDRRQRAGAGRRAAAPRARVATGGTDNHIVLVDVRRLRAHRPPGRVRAARGRHDAEPQLAPVDANGPWYTSGLRLGTPALTTLGMGTDEVDEIADVAVEVLRATAAVSVNGKASKAKYETEAKVVQEARARITALCDKFPVYPEIDLSIVEG